MEDDRLRSFTAEIAAAYCRGNTIESADLPVLLTSVYAALAGLDRTGKTEPTPREPAVPIRRSVRPDTVVCLECGFQAKMIRRHLHSVHGLTGDAYRERWSLASDYPLIAPDYSQARSSLAKACGLGRRRKEATS